MESVESFKIVLSRINVFHAVSKIIGLDKAKSSDQEAPFSKMTKSE